MNNSLSDATYIASTKKFWRKLQVPQSWRFHHLVLLLIWLLIPAYAWSIIAPAMEQQVADSVLHTLNHAPDVADQFDVINVIPDGQSMLVKAIAEPNKKILIESVAQQAVCQTWIGRDLKCPTTIEVKLEKPPIVVEPADIESTVGIPEKEVIEKVAEPLIVKEEPQKPESSHDVVWIKGEAGLELIGNVSSDQIKGTLLSQAIDQYTIKDENISVTNLAQQHDDEWAYNQAWDILSKIQNGRVDWLNGQLSISGSAYLSDEEILQAMFTDKVYSDQLGELRIDVIPEIDRCNQQFSQSLATSMIQFDIGSTSISAQSNDLLEQLAELAKNCDTRFLVEGHTDNSGSAKINRKLSQERAQAVVDSLIDKGVETERLSAFGHGEAKPIATNYTEIGRLENRRINIIAIN